MVYFYEATNYPKIYINTYWAGFKIEENFHPERWVKPIIENRNLFIFDYNIKSFKKRTIKIQNFLNEEQKYLPLDHTEQYITHDKKIIVITSPYDHIDLEPFEARGWIKIYPLYELGAVTFLTYL